MQALPFRERELRPAARFPEDIEKPLFEPGTYGLAPRILHFSGHGDAGGGSGALCFEKEDGTPHFPTPEAFIKTLRGVLDARPSLASACYKLQVTSYKLQVTSYKLQLMLRDFGAVPICLMMASTP